MFRAASSSSRRVVIATSRNNHKQWLRLQSSSFDNQTFCSSSFSSSSTSSSSSESSSALRPHHPVPLSKRVKNASQHGVSGVVATVFGATGFLGKYVVNVLGNVGSQTIIPYRGDGMNARHLKLAGDVGQVVPIPFNLKDEESIRRAMKRSNVVINLIGNRYETNNFNYHDTHVKIAHRLAKLSKEAGVERFIHVSAMGASPTSASEFLRTKFEGEQIVRAQYPDATILRPSYMVGENDYFTAKYARKLARQRQRSVNLPNAEAKVAPVYAHDVANAIFNSITYSKAAGQTYELAGPDEMTIGQMLYTIMAELGVQGKIVTSNLPVELYSKLMWPTQFIPKRHRWGFYTSDEVLRMSEDCVPFSTSELKVKQFKDLGIEPARFERTLREAIMMYKRQLHPGVIGMRDDVVERTADT